MIKTAICVSNNTERFGGKYVAFMEWTGSVLCENAVFQTKFYKVPDGFDVKKITDEHHLEGLDGVEYVDSVQNFPHIPKFNLVHMAALMFIKIWKGFVPYRDSVVYNKDPEWRYT